MNDAAGTQIKRWLPFLLFALLAGCDEPKHVDGTAFRREIELRNAQTMVWSEFLGERDGKVFLRRKTMSSVGNRWNEEIWFTETGNLDAAFLSQLRTEAASQASQAVGVPGVSPQR